MSAGARPVDGSGPDADDGSGPAPSPGSRLGHWLKVRLAIVLVVLLVIALVAGILWKRVFISIPPGQAGVLFRLFTGTKLDRVYGEGLHVIPPWDHIVRFETRKQVVLHEFDVLSNRGLPVHLALAIRYRPEYEQLPLLYQRIGPDYVTRVVLPQTESVLRRELSANTAEQIYTNEGGLLNAAILLARDEVGRNFVDADDIVIRTISLPPLVKAAIEDKLTQQELLESYVFRLQIATEEAERLRDEARGIRDYQTEVDSSLSGQLLRHEAIRATRELAISHSARLVVLGVRESGGLPVIPSGQTPGAGE